MEAAERRHEREARRRHRELLEEKKNIARMLEQQRAAYEVAEYSNRVDVLKSLHKDVSYSYDWRSILAERQPEPPVFDRAQEMAAVTEWQNYRPDLADKIFGYEEKTRSRLSQTIEQARQQDYWRYQQAMDQHRRAYERWQWFQRVAYGIMTGDLEAYRTVLTYLTPFAELEEVGGSVEVEIRRADRIEAVVRLPGDALIPTEEKTLLASGKLSSKAMPSSRFNELYQDHVCSAALRVAGEAFAVLPIAAAFVHAEVPVLDSATGRRAFGTILSVAIMRETFETLDLESIDCSDSMRNFVHRMEFKKARGFAPVRRLQQEDLAR